MVGNTIDYELAHAGIAISRRTISRTLLQLGLNRRTSWPHTGVGAARLGNHLARSRSSYVAATAPTPKAASQIPTW
jgi:hypothetical protein